MKNIKWSNIIASICYIGAGALFFLDTNLTKDIICKWIGYGLLTVGAFYIISYFTKPISESFLKNDFRDGLIIMTVGLLPLVRKDLFIELVYFVMAIVIMISGYKKLQDGVDAKRMGSQHVILYIVLASISIIIGFVIVMDYTVDVKKLHGLIGIGLLYSGITDLISTLFLSGKMYKHNNAIENRKIEEPKQEDPKQEETNENPETN